MKFIFSFLAMVVMLTAAAQLPTLPTGNPNPSSNGYMRYGYVRSDSGWLVPRRDTAWKGVRPAVVYWEHAGVDTAFWYYNMTKWQKINGNAGSVEYVVGGTGILVDSVGRVYTVKADTGRATMQLVTGGTLGKVLDSLAALIPTSFSYVDTIYRKAGQDSIFYTINGGIERAIKDSLGVTDISGKLNISDTASMLSPYLRYAYRTPGIDSIYFVTGAGNVLAVKDSAGGGTYTAGTGLVLQGSQFKIQDTLNGTGTRLMWVPSKSAFRAGGTTFGTFWDIDSIGAYSVAFNLNNKAIGIASAAFGNRGVASGYGSVVFGDNNLSSNTYSAAFGTSNISSGQSSFVAGQNSTVSGLGSFSMGSFNNVSGNISAAFGSNINQKNYGGFAIGTFNDSTDATSSTAYNSLNRAFQIGVGTSNSARENAMTVLFNGKTSLNKYGAGTFTGTATKWLAVDASGNLIEENPPSTGSDSAFNRIESVNDTTAVWVRSDGSADTLVIESDPASGGGSVEYVVSGLGIKVDSSGRTYTINSDTASATVLSKQRADNSYWKLFGNSGTSATTNFIGTTDDVDLVFRRNNVRAGLLNTSLNNTSFGVSALSAITTGTGNTALGRSALSAISTGIDNVAIGRNAMLFASGSNNLGIGTSSLQSATGGNNVAVGSNASLRITTANNTVAIGDNSLREGTTGGNNIGIGWYAMSNNTTGTENTAIGYATARFLSDGTTANQTSLNSVFIGAGTRSGPTAGLTNQIVVGYQAISVGSNSAVLGNSSIATTILRGQVGLGTEAPATTALLDLTSTTRGLLLPRMTTVQRNAISSPADGLMVFCTDCTATDGSTGVSQTYSSSAWRNHY